MASADREKIRALAAKAHMSMSDYATACCLGKRIVVIDEQKELLRQLKGIGSNINRLTVLANMGKVQVTGLDKAAQELSEVSAALRAVMEGRGAVWPSYILWTTNGAHSPAPPCAA